MAMYQPPIDNTNTQTDGKVNKPQTIADLFKTAEVQKNYQEQNKDKGLFAKMEDVYDRPIAVMSFKVTQEKSQFREGTEEFTRIKFRYLDDNPEVIHECRTQSKGLIRVLEAIGNERLEAIEGGLSTMICMKKKGANTILWFDGIEFA